MSQQFRLMLQLTAEEIDERGYPISNSRQIRDNFVLGAMGSLEMAKVLGRFHELAQVIEREREDMTG
jgi:hypothetical protein